MNHRNRQIEVGAESSEFDFEPDQLVRRLLALPSHRRLSLLDSCGLKSRGAGLLIAGFDPIEVIEMSDGRARITRAGEEVFEEEADALELLNDRLRRYATSRASDSFLAGACIATLSYDYGRRLERSHGQHSAAREDNEPDAVFAFYDVLIVHDYFAGKTTLRGENRARVEEIRDDLKATAPVTENNSTDRSIAAYSTTKAEYLAGVERIKEHIAAGDIYQANLTQQVKVTLPESLRPHDVFLRLRRDHPSPFAAYMNRGDDVVVSISPERFLRVTGAADQRKVEAWPIKGTRPRGESLAEDSRLREELSVSRKDRAENVMIVDLLRNDLGRVSRYGSIRVTELCTIEEHPTLFHLVSRVEGKLRDGVTAGDLLRASFPCGSITGAPKIRAMEIIDEVETVPRGLSMGAIGYFGFDGSIDLNVAIRTMTIRDGVARFSVGGGIVADSEPVLEYEESLVKARALLQALGVT
jgi:para-aminobenzoate synthetase component 1